MIRAIVGGAFQRWGFWGAVVVVLLMLGIGSWVLTYLEYALTASVWGLGAVAGFVYLSLFGQLVLWLRRRGRDEHLLRYGRRRRWPQ